MESSSFLFCEQNQKPKIRFCIQKEKWEQVILTANKRSFGEGFPPILRNLDRVFCFCHRIGGISLILSMLHDLRNVIPLKSVEHVEKIVSTWDTSLWHFCREISHQFCVVLHQYPKTPKPPLLFICKFSGRF